MSPTPSASSGGVDSPATSPTIQPSPKPKATKTAFWAVVVCVLAVGAYWFPILLSQPDDYVKFVPTLLATVQASLKSISWLNFDRCPNRQKVCLVLPSLRDQISTHASLHNIQSILPQLDGYIACQRHHAVENSNSSAEVLAAFFQEHKIPGMIITQHPIVAETPPESEEEEGKEEEAQQQQEPEYIDDTSFCFQTGYTHLNNSCDYWLLLDADQQFVSVEDAKLACSNLSSAPALWMTEHALGITFAMKRLFRVGLNWTYTDFYRTYTTDSETEEYSEKMLPDEFYSLVVSKDGTDDIDDAGHGVVGDIEAVEKRREEMMWNEWPKERLLQFLDATLDQRPDDCSYHYEVANKLKQLGFVDEAIQHWIVCARQTAAAFSSPQEGRKNSDDVSSFKEYRGALQVAQELQDLHGKTDKPLSDRTHSLLASWFDWTPTDVVQIEDIAQIFTVVSQAAPEYREAPHRLARFHRYTGSNERCYEQAKEAISRPKTLDGADLTNTLNDEVCVCAYYTPGKRIEGLNACQTLLKALQKESNPNQGTIDRISYNIVLYDKILGPTFGKPPRLIDAFLFDGQLDVLAVRLAELSDMIDLFIIIESTTTACGKPRETVYDKNKHRYTFVDYKVEHLIIDDSNSTALKPWERVRNQRNHILSVLDEYNEDKTLIIIGDVDEIPDLGVLQQFKSNKTPLPEQYIHFKQDMYYRNISLKLEAPWEKSFITSVGVLKRHGDVDWIRRNPIISWHVTGGWHFSCFADDAPKCCNEAAWDDGLGETQCDEGASEKEVCDEEVHIAEVLPAIRYRYLPHALRNVLPATAET